MVSNDESTQLVDPVHQQKHQASLALPKGKVFDLEEQVIPQVSRSKIAQPKSLHLSTKDARHGLKASEEMTLIAQPSSEESESQMQMDASTQYKTNISSALSEFNSPQQQNVSELPPLEGFSWQDLLFPETDVLDLRVQTERGDEIKLMTYRWAPKTERKGVVFLIHGYGSCAPHLAVIAKYLAEDDLEVFSMDMRGQGDSEGERGSFEGADQVYADTWAMIFEACKKFKINQQKTPIFLFARSFGGLIATNMASTVLGQSMFAGVLLLTPYYRLFTERLYDAYKWLIPLTYVKPGHIFKCEFEEMDPEYLEKYKPIFFDERNVEFFTAVTARLWVEEQAKARECIKQVTQPVCFVMAGAENVVRNDYIEEFYSLSTSSMKELHEVKSADHTDICFHEAHCSELIRKSLAFFQKVLKSRQQ